MYSESHYISTKPHFHERVGIIAAEVKFHADTIYSWVVDIPWLGDKWYLAALRADMTFGEETESGYFDGYYDLDNSIVTEQAAVHGER